jgi:hypothetical protein
MNGGVDNKSCEVCPFCHEEDFDLIGLKSHLLNGNCPVFEDTEFIRSLFK